ncbi:MAG: ferrochelatase [Thermoplasmata archaeon]
MSDAAPFGVLLMGYGSPSGPEALPGYLTEVMHGRTPSAATVAEYTRRYERIGGTPQPKILSELRERLERRLARDRPGARVFLATKHAPPRISEVIPEAAREGFEQLRAVALSPYASTWITEPYRAGIAEGIRAADRPITVELRSGWHLDPDWIRCWADRIRSALDRPSERPEVVLLSAHSLPSRFRDQGDPYPGLVRATADAVAHAAGLTAWEFTYQSPGNTTEPWLGPDILDVMRGWKERGASTQLIAATGFVFDHLETLYDLDVVVKEAAEAQGIVYRRVPMPNADPGVVEALARRLLGPAGAASL